jgi:hypothetical protein
LAGDLSGLVLNETPVFAVGVPLDGLLQIPNLKFQI